MEIIKNNKTYSYFIPDNDDYDYEYLAYKLAELNIERVRINLRFCWIFSKKKILTKLKKYFKNRVKYDGIDDYDNSYMYTIILLNDEEFNNFKIKSEKLMSKI